MRKFRVFFILTAIAIAPVVHLAHAELARPSFDCSKASSRAEILICGSDDLAEADVELTKVYRTAVASSADSKLLASQQRQWLQQVRDACQDAQCLLDAYRERTSSILVRMPGSNAERETSRYSGADAPADLTGEMVQRLSNMPRKTSFDERYAAIRSLLDQLLLQPDPPSDSDSLVEFLHQQESLLLMAPPAVSRNGEPVFHSTGELATARADTEKIERLWKKAKTSGRNATKQPPQPATVVSGATQAQSTSSVEQSSAPPTSAQTSESDSFANIPQPATSGNVITSQSSHERESNAPQSAPSSTSAAPRDSSSSSNQTVTSASGTPKEEATGQKTVWSYFRFAWLAIVVLGIVLGFTKHIVVYRDFDDLGLLFLMPVILIGWWFFSAFVGDGPFVQELLGFLAIAGELAIFAYVAWRTYQDNSSWWAILIALITKTSLGFLFVLNLFSLIHSKQAKERRSALLWLTILAPIVYGLVKNKVGFWAPHDSLSYYRRRQLGI